MRLLGVGARQSFTAWAHKPLEVAFGGPHTGTLQKAWIGARILPTPNGYYRAVAGPVWRG